MKKNSLLLVGIVVFALVAYLIFRPTPALKIGYVSGTTGALAEVGVDGRNAFLLKIEEVNSEGGINGQMIEPVVLNDQNDPEQVPVVHEEFDEEEVRFIVGHIISSLDEAVLLEAKKDKLILSASMSSAKLDGIDDNFVRLTSSYANQVAVLSDYIWSVKGVGSLTVVYDRRNAAYAQGFYETLSEIYPGTVVHGIAVDGETDFSKDVIDEMLSQPTDGIVMITPSLTTATLCQLLDQKDMDVQRFGVSWSMTNELFKEGGQTVNGLELVYIDLADEYATAYTSFRNKFIEAYGYEPSTICYNTYEAISVMVEAIEASGDLTVSDVKGHLVNREFSGLWDDILIDPYGDRQQEFYMYQAYNGQFNKIDYQQP